MWTRAVLIGAIGLAAGSTAGCAEEREPINRVQANALAKSFFVGDDLKGTEDDPEFWTRSTVVDVGYGASQDGLFNSSWAQADLSRIKWVIQEDLLVARLTYERIDGTDGKGAGKATKDGLVVAAFPILSHFDIKRDYNPATGEESNIVVENTSDRAWHERTYMRVDWSKNLNTDSYDFDTLSIIGVYGGVKYEALSYYVNDPTDPDAPQFDPNAGYFDVTTKAFAMPQVIDISSFGWGIDALPACFVDNDFMHGTAPSGNCNPVEVTIRHSFRKVVDNDYEVAEWDGKKFSAYGPFMNERYGYARNFGMSDEKWHRFANRFQIWEKSHVYNDGKPVECYNGNTPPDADPNRDDNGNGTSDECEAVGRGSRCDTFRQACTLPYRDRTPKPLAWHYTQGSNPEYFDGTEWAVHEWDVAMRSAVMVAKYAECKRVNDGDDCGKYPVYFGQMDDQEDAIRLAREVDACRNQTKIVGPDGLPTEQVAYAGRDCNQLAVDLGNADPAHPMDPAVIALAQMPEMIALCHSPVAEGDAEVCGDVGTVARYGDLRFHNVNAFTAPQVPSAWGIYTDSEDPLTGEKISASINIWTHVNDLFAQGVIDVVRYIKGELKTADVTEGAYIRDWVNANEQAAQQGSVLPPMTRNDVDKRVADFLDISLEEYREAQTKLNQKGADPKALQVLKQADRIVRGTKAEAGAQSANRATYEWRRQAAKNTPLELELMTPAMQQYAGVENLPLSDEVLAAASPLRGNNPVVQREFKRTKDMAFANKGACVLEAPSEAPAPLSVHGVADLLEEKFEKFDPTQSKDVQMARAERMRKWLAQRAHYGVIIHEMGHSVGMRHNFLSSWDSFNYRPQYWQLRTKNGTIQEECTDLATDDGTSCVGPRYHDPVTEEERKNMVWMWSQSSVMDYPGDHLMDTIGLGAYDFAAARMFYGDMVAVHADDTYKAGKPRGDGVVERMDSFGGLLGLEYTVGPKAIHYSQLNKEYDLLLPGSCYSVGATAEEVRAKFRPATWNDARDGVWHPVLDGQIVQVDGQYTRCKQQKVDYVPWNSLTDSVIPGQEYRGAVRSFDQTGRTRVPYPFATDSWADLGNLSVYRHDNGADAYELINFWIAQQEVNHVFDNYRRGKHGFSVRSAASRTLGRYSTKMRDAAKGLSLLRNIVDEIALAEGGNADAYWKNYVGQLWSNNVLISGIVFDHFTRQMARPQAGTHASPTGDVVLRSLDDAYFDSPARVIIPNGATGYYNSVGIGGRLLENRLPDDKGEWDRDYTLNAGSYYDKINTGYLMTESEDNFISASRTDYLDPRYRAVSLADLFPEGFRRWVGNNLTGDDFIKGARLTASASGAPELEENAGDFPEAKDCKAPGCKYPKNPIGWTSWWIPSGPESCFPGNASIVCKSYTGTEFNPQAPANLVAIDPQVGWDQQKFLIANVFMYLPENQKLKWFDMMSIWELGVNADPGFANRIEFHNPTGKVWIAKTYGKEALFGKTVQKGIAARVLEWANHLLVQAYATEEGPDLDADGKADWYTVLLDANGQPTVLNDAARIHLERYESVVWFLASTPYWMQLEKKGLYD
jgi:hypothetical protein